MFPPCWGWQPADDGSASIRTDGEVHAEDHSCWAAEVRLADASAGVIPAAVFSHNAADDDSDRKISAAVVVVRPAVYDYEEDELIGVTETIWACEVVLARISAHGLVPADGSTVTVCLCCGETQTSLAEDAQPGPALTLVGDHAAAAG